MISSHNPTCSSVGCPAWERGGAAPGLHVRSRGLVPVRDSKVPSGPVLSFPASSFSSFLMGVKEGTFGAV
ncbi:DUF397 domain-containing protein [Streptomyces sp. NPDC053069]|uniref:DUF397 domain-containing protein n=1 Tax=Streptomyces sp. NPDC053069 TaxID=3365695 RepID=UPI0037CF5E78